MFTYEERIRAVQLYLKLGKRSAQTRRQLGYPSKNALKSWCREYERSNDLSVGYRRQTSKYSETDKRIALEHFFTHGCCIAWTLKALGYPCRATLTAWLYELNGEKGNVSGASVGPPAGIESQPQLAETLSSMKRKFTLPLSSDPAQLQQQVESLQQELRRLQLERDILKMSNDILKKDLGVTQNLLTNREKTLLIDALKSTYTLAELLGQLKLPRSSYFYHQRRMHTADKYEGIRQTMTEIFEDNHRCYGYRRIHASLNRQQYSVSEKVVRRLMKQEQLKVARPRRRRYASYLGEISPAPENLINRNFHADAPNQKWLTDITEFQIPAGKVYLSPIVDCFDGLVTSWSIGTRPDAELVNTMLDSAIETVADKLGRPVIHSDRGGHYRWSGWLSRIDSAKLTRSMSRKGCSPDNAACEGFFGRLKNELFYPRDWRSTTIKQFIQILDDYIRWYNEKRIKISLGSKSPLEYRESLGLAA